MELAEAKILLDQCQRKTIEHTGYPTFVYWMKDGVQVADGTFEHTLAMVVFDERYMKTPAGEYPPSFTGIDAQALFDAGISSRSLN